MKKILLALCIAVLALGAQEPILRVGIMTDTHIGKTERRCQNIRKAFQFFKNQKVELMIHLGDIADRHTKTGYEITRRYFNEIFGGKKPKELWLYANHDSAGTRGKPWEKMLKEALQIPNNPYDKLVLKGYPFLVFPERVNLKRQESTIQQTIKDFPGKPVFVLDHVPAAHTTENSVLWGHQGRREMLDKFPQVIQLSGHTHNSLRNELCIWQGNFTAVNCGCLQAWRGNLTGTAPEAKRPDEVIVMEIFSDKIYFRCYSTTDGKEVRPDHPWCIPWPFDPEKAPYNPEHRLKTSPKPQFDKDAKVTMKVQKTPFERFLFTFPEAKHPEYCYRYMLNLKKKDKAGAWQQLSCKEYFGSFWQAVPKKTLTADFSAGFFEENSEYQLSIIPRNYYGGEGKPLLLEFKAPKLQPCKVVFECKDPMKELPFLDAPASDLKIKRKGYIHRNSRGYMRLMPPDEIWEGKKGTKFRYILDLALDQPETPRWLLQLRYPTVSTDTYTRISTTRKSDCQRIVFEFSKPRDNYNYYVVMLKGVSGTAVLKYIRIEKLSLQ